MKTRQKRALKRIYRKLRKGHRRLAALAVDLLATEGATHDQASLLIAANLLLAINRELVAVDTYCEPEVDLLPDPA